MQALSSSVRSACATANRPLAGLRVVSAVRIPLTRRTPVPKATPAGPQPEASNPDAPKSTSEIAKEALMDTVSGKPQTAEDVLGKGTIAQLKSALGEERASQLLGALDGLLANRRLATLVFAVVDIALIWLAIKVFRSTVLHD